MFTGFLVGAIIAVFIVCLIYSCNKEQMTKDLKEKITQEVRLDAIKKIKVELKEETEELRELESKTVECSLELTEKVLTITKLKGERDKLKVEIDLLPQIIEEKKRSADVEIETYNSLLVEGFLTKKKEIQDQIDLAEQELDTLVKSEQNANRLKLELDDDKHRRLLISKRATFELEQLTEVLAKVSLSNPMPFYRAIYDVYWKNAVATLTESLDVKKVSGIYKIVNDSNGKIYIGQSTDVGERWKQHIKRGCGAEIGTVAGGGLYEAMMEEGLATFSFYLVEEVEKSMLNERERFWIGFYESKAFGYNLK